MNGKFIVIEGIDNAGKGTQSTLLTQHLRENGLKVVLTKEPTNGILGGLSKAALNKEINISGRALQLLFCADRAHHIETEIEPMMSKGLTVICDRYFFSTLAYGFVSGINYKWLRSVNINFRKPDLGIYLDLDPKVSLSRMPKQDGIQLFDTIQKISKVRQAYISISKEFHLKKVDANGSVSEVSQKINKIVDKFLNINEKKSYAN
ncbi:MAG: dTMP kinase [Candidatus Parvarchaeum acidophilus ARMAN-5]|jgi:dTMP kinase|uniref:Probable thymidylate kinase n=1 Tax=Candidatus Parvarchaeum acidophilus ARMAN-5 TaxID=662762 RepID=D6GWU1_PARA5|nr:MAG: dTMP kinase [Candidatus Parvarchaeum acidophilus ARMAN-5]